jgi:SAM-dependent methyltransferase
MTDQQSAALFFELFSGLPLQGPGDADSTRRALSMVPSLNSAARILDVGCGTGAQTFDLARFTPARIVAVDLHPPFVQELNRTSADRGLADRVQAVVGDMGRLEFPPEHFDLIWSEGAIYTIGFDTGLDVLHQLLKPGGHLGVSELSWFKADPPGDCVDFFAAEYPAMRDLSANRAAGSRLGYDCVGDFCLPSLAWARNYYEPLSRNLAAFRSRHQGDAAAEAIASQCEREIDMYARYSDWYGYGFFVMRKRRT